MGIIELAIKRGRTPGDFTEEDIEHWKQQMFRRGRSLLTVLSDECYFRKILRQGQQFFPNFSLASRNSPKYRLKVKDLPESLRNEIVEVVRWKTADEDLDDRDAALVIRPVSGENLKGVSL